MQRLLLILIGMLAASLASAGTITGIVTAQGKNEAEGAAGGGRYDSRKFKFVEKINYAELRDFVVFIDGPVTNTARATNLFKTVLTQKDAMFKPHVLPVYLGTTVRWPNEDDIFHNVFSMSEPKEFDLGLYKGNPTNKAVKFDKSGRVDVFCSIHSDMHCIVLVIQNPCFASTDAKGRYSISDVPPGTYKLKAWHERLPPQTKEITVPESGPVKLDFTLGIHNLPQY
ncbi:MAG TPA: carboxypeptidase regulatory-like domain-containing protein [Candidatus Limnocylindria bacterium]|nr:carboxypeptidase regulatory-like domain-containing protein [Candidatus Limnocylindria bacterium]